MELNRSIRNILALRGISAAEDVAEYFCEKPQRTYDPLLMKGMEEGVEQILAAISTGEKICVYGDYDADGVTSVALLTDVLREMGAEVIYYIPSRFDEGYGLNSAALDKIKATGCGLVVTVDCGCTSVAEVEHAQEIGLDILITDHHELKAEIPDCVVIDPKQPDCPYPCKVLAGVGVAFKLAQALVYAAGLPKQVLTRNLDLVGIGTIGDIVPLIDENRTLAKYGLRAINVTNRPGLKALIRGIGLVPGEINSQNVSFAIVPHINAAGRMGDAALAARLMKTTESVKAAELTEKLKHCNTDRKMVQKSIYEACVSQVTDEMKAGGFLLIRLQEAHEGVIGIACGKLKETYRLPSFIVTRTEDGKWKGTGRSVDGVDIFAILSRAEQIFLRFGGHAAACGFTIEEENLPLLETALRVGMRELGTAADRGWAQAELVLPDEDVSLEFCDQQKLMEPFGKGNEMPSVGIRVQACDLLRMGSEKQYLRFGSRLQDGRVLKTVAFRNADEIEAEITRASGGEVLVIGNLEEQEWKGTTYLQMNAKAVRPNMPDSAKAENR